MGQKLTLVSLEEALMCLTGEYTKEDYKADELIAKFARRLKGLHRYAMEVPEDGEGDGCTGREALEKIRERLARSGWCRSKEDSGSLATYQKEYGKKEATIGIEVALEPEALGAYGWYGVCCTELMSFGRTPPYIRDDLARMQELIAKAEQDLLDAGIPFRPSYGFAKRLERSLRANLELRERYGLAALEAADMDAE